MQTFLTATSRHIFVILAWRPSWISAHLLVLEVFDFNFFELFIPRNLCVDNKINLLGEFLKNVMSRNRFFFYVSAAAILDFCTMYCFDVFLFFEFLIPKNLSVDTKMKLLGAFLSKL